MSGQNVVSNSIEKTGGPMNNRFFLTMIIFMVMFVGFSVRMPAQIAWESDWAKGMKDAAAKQHPVLLDFYTDWCPHCKHLDATTFKEPKVVNYFKTEKYVLIKINPEKDKGAESKFKVFSYPTLIVYNGKGEEVDRILGYLSGEELLKALDDLKKGIGTLDDLLKKQKKIADQQSKENFELLAMIINKYIARADYTEALALVARIVELDKDNAMNKASKAIFQKGYIYYKWKKYKEAVEALLAIRTLYPKSEEAPMGYLTAGYYCEKIGDKPGALKIYKEFLVYFPDYSEAGKIADKIKGLEPKTK